MSPLGRVREAGPAGCFEEPAGGHGWKPTRLGNDEEIGVAVEDRATSRDVGFYRGRAIPRDLVALTHSLVGPARSVAEVYLSSADALVPLVARRVPMRPRKVLQKSTLRVGMSDSLLVPEPAVETHEAGP